MSEKNILILAGDGIGPEIITQAHRLLSCIKEKCRLNLNFWEAKVGGSAIDAYDDPLPDATLQLAKRADVILLGAVGGPKWDGLPMEKRPEKGLLGLRSALHLFANLRPAILYPQLVDASTLKAEVVSGLNLMIVRELTGDVYFGQPRGIRVLVDGQKEGFNTLVYREDEIVRIAKVAFEIARLRHKRVCSVDKANVLEATRLWREVVSRVGLDYPDVALSHLYVDNAAMQLVKAPKQFDVMLAPNMFGDILSDCAAMLTGSIGMLPSASLDQNNKGMYEPIHGSAPDIANQDIANPIATLLSVAMLMRYTFDKGAIATHIENAVSEVLSAGLRTADIFSPEMHKVGTAAMGDAIIQAFKSKC